MSKSNETTPNVPTLRFSQYHSDWTRCSLSDIANVVGGGTPDTADETLWNGDIQWFTPTEVGHSKYVSKSIRTISQSGLKKSSAKILPNGSVLLSSRATVGECSIAKIDCTTNQGFQSLIPKNNVNNEFLYYLAQTKKRHFIKYASGSTFLEISNSEIKKTKCFVPRIEEQTKIAEFLSLIDRKLEVQNKIIKHRKSLIFSLVIEILLSLLSLIESALSLNVFSFFNNLLKLLWTIFKEVKNYGHRKKHKSNFRFMEGRKKAVREKINVCGIFPYR